MNPARIPDIAPPTAPRARGRPPGRDNGASRTGVVNRRRIPARPLGPPASRARTGIPRAAPAAAAVQWDRSDTARDGADDWWLSEVAHEDEDGGRIMAQTLRSPPGARAAVRIDLANEARPSAAHQDFAEVRINLADHALAPVAPRPAAAAHLMDQRRPPVVPTTARVVAAPPFGDFPELGLFEVQGANIRDDFLAIRPPTAAELIAVSEDAVRLLFCDRRLAEITRARSASDDVKAAAALKAQRCLTDQGWRHGQLDAEHHAVYYGFQARFLIGSSPTMLGQLIGWATPFGLDRPGDISKTPEWAEHRTTAAALFPRLETAVFASRTPAREFSMPGSLFVQIRKLAVAYFCTRARTLAPLLAQLPDSPLHDQAKTIIRAYIAQARDLPILWAHLENSIVDGALNEHLTDPAVVENAARVSMARPFLTALLSGQVRGWGAAQMIAAHQSHVPSAALLHSTDFSQLVLTSAQAAQFALTIPGPASATSGPSPPDGSTYSQPSWPPYAPPRAPPPPSLYVTPSPLSAPSPPAALPPPAYPPPAGPPAATPPGPPTSVSNRARASTVSALCIPPSKAIVTSASPFTTMSSHPCDYCGMTAHAQYECPKRFFDTYGRPLPGFLRSGEYDPTAWSNGDLLPAARRAMAAYLTELRIPTHRKFGVTADHVASGVAPPPPKP